MSCLPVATLLHGMTWKAIDEVTMLTAASLINNIYGCEASEHAGKVVEPYTLPNHHFRQYF